MIRSGAWLVPARLRAWCGILLAGYAAGILFMLATSDGVLDLAGRQLGTDFSQVWAAGRSVLAGDAMRPFDLLAHGLWQRQFFGPETDVFGWHYPPYFLLVATPLALLPYLPALAVWQLGTLLPLLAVVRRIIPGRDALLAALAFPGAFVNLAHGHNGFLTALLMGAGLLALERRPALAGACFALLAYKPQFGLVVALILLLDRRPALLLGACGTLAGMTALTFLAFGTGPWLAFLEALPFTREFVLEQGSTGWQKIQSVFAFVRYWGGSIPLAYAAQGLVTAAVLAAVAWGWRRPADPRLRLALIPVASLLVTPYALDYDMVVLGLSIAFLAAAGLARGFRPWAVTLLALAWVSPIATRAVFGATGIPLGVLAMLAVLVLALSAIRTGARSALAESPEP